MSKAILVIDMPEKCVGCDLHQWVDIENYENNEIRCLRNRSKPFDANDDKPSWCPLRPLPEKDAIPPSVTSRKAEFGWIRCIEEILGEK